MKTHSFGIVRRTDGKYAAYVILDNVHYFILKTGIVPDEVVSKMNAGTKHYRSMIASIVNNSRRFMSESPESLYRYVYDIEFDKNGVPSRNNAFLV